MFSNVFSPPEILAVYEVMRKNTVVPDRPQMAVRRVRFGCCIIKAANTHSEYVILTVFPGNNRYTIASLCYVVRILPVLYRNSNFFIIFLQLSFVSLFSIFFYSFTVSLVSPIIVVGMHMEETS